MKGDYPRFKASYSHDELVEHFHLDTQDRVFISGICGDVNRNAAAILLKSLLYLGYFPTDLDQVPDTVRTFIANQLGLLWDHTDQYQWESGTRDYYFSLTR